MKKCLFAIVLLYPGQYASADATFEFNSLIPKNNQHSLTYYIKNARLKYTDATSASDNIYDHKSKQFTSLNKKTGKVSSINEQILNRQVARLNEQRMNKLVSIEKELNQKLSTKTDLEKQTGENLINRLKYPEHYGEHSLLNIKELKKTKQINNIKCQRFQLFRQHELLKEYCMASAADLGINQQEYKTLRGFYAFDYNTQSKIMIAMGNTRFAIVDYDQQKIPGVVIETISYEDNQITQHQVLKSVNNDSLNDSIFSLNNENKTQ